MNNTKYIFFSGKGGVGKTTMACATAIHYANEGKKTLIVTTDPASNLADVFETEIGHKITPLLNNLWGMEIDPDKATEEYRERILSPMRAVMPESVMTVLEEQFNSPCTTEIASFDRFVDFMVAEKEGKGEKYDVVIFDTAPTGHTIRLLELPVDWSKHIEESAKGSGNTCIGPVASIQENKAKYDEATRLLGDAEKTTFIFVLQPEEISIYETKRSSMELKEIGIQNIELIINGILPEEVCEHPFFKNRFEMQQKYIKTIEAEFPGKTLRKIYQRDGEIKGVERLLNIEKDLFNNSEKQNYTLEDGEFTKAEFNKFMPDSIEEIIRPNGKTKSIFFTGKGGVGKTVISVISAFKFAKEGYKTLLLTTDPASHIGEVLEQNVTDKIQKIEGVENLWSVIVDQEKATEEYKQRIIEESKSKYSEDMIIAIKEELESPCTEEMAAFDKFMSYVESDDYDFVVFDTAPTGHTLRLLELPFDYSDQVSLMVTTNVKSQKAKSITQKRFDRIIAKMKDPNQSIFAFVVYPESTPVIEAYRAMLDLKDAGIQTQFVVANQVLEPEYCTNEFFIKRRKMQEKYLNEIKEKFQLPVTVMPLLESEIKGMEMIQKASELLFNNKVIV
ncbi:TRC40/GET3/ArsA family transport-energizing ATPase [Melioribacteraceae bacterium 4301-Me]|uniref:TRC40/GET3/ArsA family transport-energizing ATPase n=1 Tax=Pyranulibacter aquaticus TaxID=3163344 RepID=UPI003596FAB1